MSFDDNNGNKPKQRVGLKLNNQGSIFANVPKKPSQQDLEKNVQEAQSRSRDYKERAAELALIFKKMLDDRTILQNKNSFTVESEREVIGKLAQLGVDMNVDEFEQEGMGSLGLITLLFRSLLIQRDKINYLDYSINQIKIEIKSMQATLVDKNQPSE